MHVRHACVQLAFQGLSPAFDPLLSYCNETVHEESSCLCKSPIKADLLFQDQGVVVTASACVMDI